MPVDGVWQAVLGEVELSVSRGNFVTWFKSTSLIRHDTEGAIIGVPNIFIKQQLEKKYTALLRETLQRNGIAPKELLFKIQAAPLSREADEPILIAQPAVAQKPVSPTSPLVNRSSLSHSYRQGLNERYTFDNFIVGSGSELAFAACQSIVSYPRTKYNPLFLY